MAGGARGANDRTVRTFGRWAALLSLALAAGAGGCGGALPPSQLPPEGLLSRAEERLERERYADAQLLFQQYLDRFPGDPQGDRAQLGIARCFLGLKDWPGAREQLETLIQRYPDSPSVETARFLLGVSFARESLPAEMDQSLTHKSLDELEAYLADYPRGQHRDEASQLRRDLRAKLARKNLANGNLYRRMGYPEAAIRYYEMVVRLYPETAQTAEARLGLAEAFRAMKRWNEADSLYRAALEDAKDDPGLQQRIERRLKDHPAEGGQARS